MNVFLLSDHDISHSFYYHVKPGFEVVAENPLGISKTGTFDTMVVKVGNSSKQLVLENAILGRR